MQQGFMIVSAVSIVIVFIIGLIWSPFLWLLLPVLFLVTVGFYDMWQVKHTIWRNFPVIGRGRMLIEILRPPFQQYFVESETDGRPVSRMFRSLVYQRAKNALDTNPFGTKVDVYRIGYEWMDHSLAAISHDSGTRDLRVMVGGPDCTKPYNASLLNISAMSFGALSKNAIMALNGGAQLGGFAHNTGEGGLSPYHLEKGGDIIWQIGTGYFGCRNPDGSFSEELFAEKACLDVVKMIELKLSQGAKPGHGGILPATKNTEEIAKIRGVEPGTQIDSPPTHKSFSNPIELMEFIGTLRKLSGGKPVGFKLCVGRKSELVALCKAMISTGIKPDFITVDGGEGGTGAAPLEYSNSVGMPLREALAFVIDCLMGFDLKKDIKVAASGMMFSGFQLVKNLALGADMCNSARGMMLALGCIQALECNNNNCPTGISTQNPKFVKGLVVDDKIPRIANFHRQSIKSVAELLAAAGLVGTEKLNRSHINRRVNATMTQRYDEVFPYIAVGDLLAAPYPERFSHFMNEATERCFSADHCIVSFGDSMGLVEN
ncbi:MAG: glutamate synthase domain-containing protein 2 [Desulforhopalus sp.]|jgi:glutamate synthase domain-containing protein 2